MQLRHILLAITVAALWGFNFIAVKVGLSEMPPFLYCFARFVVACFPFLLFLKEPPPFMKKPAVSWLLIIGIGFSLGVAKFGFMFMGLHLGMSAGIASLVLQSQVFFTTFFSVLMLADSLRINQVIGMIIAFGGIAIIGINLHEESTLVGFLLILAAAISWAFCNIMIKLAGKVNMFSLVLWTSLVPILPMYLLSFIYEGPEALPNMLAQMTALGWACLLFTVCGATWVGSTLWGILLRTYNASVVAPFALLIPVFGITFGHIFLAEQFNFITYAACGVVFLGLVINQWRPTTVDILPLQIANRIFFPKKAA